MKKTRLLRKIQSLILIGALAPCLLGNNYKSRGAIIKVISKSSGPGYSLPQIGEALAIGTNFANDLVGGGQLPSNFDLRYAAFNCFGGGAFNPDYSSHGAFVVASSGGHGCPELTDAVIFDFATQSWKLLKNSNGVPSSSTAYSQSQITNSKYAEVSNFVPAPSHLYQSTSYLPRNLGGGSNGSFLKLTTRFAALTPDNNPGANGLGAHGMDLMNGKWSRLTDDVFSTSTYDFYSAPVAVFDEDKRYYLLDASLHSKQGSLADGSSINQRLVYLEYQSSGSWKIKASTATFPSPGDFTCYPGCGTPTYFWDSAGKVIVSQGGPNSGNSSWPFRYIDPNNISAGWKTIGIEGITQPKGGSQAPRWAYYPPNDCFYAHLESQGNSLYQLCPPSKTLPARYATSWTLKTISVTGASLPNYVQQSASDGYKAEGPVTLFYVKSIDSLAWVSGHNTKVIILRPPAP